MTRAKPDSVELISEPDVRRRRNNRTASAYVTDRWTISSSSADARYENLDPKARSAAISA
jgi:hypothetical protein